MQTMNTKVDGCALTSLHNLIVELFLNLGNHLFNTSRMNASVGNQLMQGQAANLSADRIESRDYDSLGSVVNYDFNTTGSFQGTDVTAFTSDDTAFHLVIINMENAYRILNGGFSSNALNRLDNYLLGLLVGIKFGLVHNFIHIAGSIGTGFVLKAFHQAVLCLLCTQSRQLFQLHTLLLLHLLQVFLLHDEQLLLIVNTLLLLIQVLLAASKFFLTLVQAYLALLQFILTLLDFLVALLNFLVQLSLLVQELLLNLKELFLFQILGFLGGNLHHFLVFTGQTVPENQVSA